MMLKEENPQVVSAITRRRHAGKSWSAMDEKLEAIYAKMNRLSLSAARQLNLISREEHQYYIQAQIRELGRTLGKNWDVTFNQLDTIK
jgi:hypothetical protein